ncbi:MAG: tRNA epoxyqueuosine(34) reductase QueG [Pseudomonadota bacterium]
MTAADEREALVQDARAAGFDAVRVARVDAFAARHGKRLEAFIDAGHEGDMAWLATSVERRRRPTAMWAQARSAIMLAMNYAPAHDPLTALRQRERAVVSVYAGGKDYHAIIKARLKQVAGAFQRRSGAQVKVFVDTAPLMEKPLAAQAGLGWQGKHTNLVSRAFGSCLFLGAVLTDAELAADEPHGDVCGRCRRCVDVCPTAAFVGPYQLDARRCISYLTIEHKGQIDRALRPLIGNRVFGCDDCLAVCPWNKYAQAARETRFAPRAGVGDATLAELLAMTPADFATRFQGTPVKRAGYARFIRNVLVGAGNAGDARLVPAVKARLDDPSPLVRGMAVWALARLMPRAAFDAEGRAALAWEQDADVRAEWCAEGLARQDA